MLAEDPNKNRRIEYGDVLTAFENGSVPSAPKKLLEEYLLALARPRILDEANRARAAQMGEFIRNRLVMLQAEDQNMPGARREAQMKNSLITSKTIVFVGSSKEAESQARVLMRALASPRIEFLPWWECFTPGQLLLDDLEAVRTKASAALLLLTPDVPAKVRGKKTILPNQNVLFELGFFFSAFTRSRIALVRYGATHIPKDLDGYTHVPGSRSFTPKKAIPAGKKTRDAFAKWVASL